MPTNAQQRGAVAIEFAAIFLLFFTLVYGAFAFALPAVARLSFQHWAAEAARAAMRVDTDAPHATVLARLGEQVEQSIAHSWLPGAWRGGCDVPESAPWQPLPGTMYGHWAYEAHPAPSRSPRYLLHVCLQANDPIVPQVKIGNLYLPPHNDDSGRPWVRGYTITHL
ncbi:TadE/TadG family type IV pilus assembly protein [Vreelandella sp. TE19]